MGFDAFKDKVTETVSDVLGNEQQTDAALDKAEELVNDKTDNKFSDKVEQGRDFIDGKVGDER